MPGALRGGLVPLADLAPRTHGLLPLWLVPAVAVVWALAAVAGYRLDRRQRTGLTAEIGAIGGLILGWLLFFWQPLLTSAEVPQGGGDLNSFFFPLQAVSAAAIRAGQLPLWNPYLHGGMPQLANFQAAVLYPPNLLADALARPFQYGTLEMLAIAHYLIASLGVYLLARSLGASRLGGVAAGLVLPYGGFMVAHLGHYSMLSVAAWIPWLLLTLRLAVVRASWTWAAATAVVVFLMTTGGHQQMLLYGLTAGFAWWIFWVVLHLDLFSRLRPASAPILGGTAPALTDSLEAGSGVDWRPLVRPLSGQVVRVGVAVAAGVGLAAPMLLPSLQLARLSVRSALSYAQSTEFSVEPVALLHLIVPKVFGSNPTDYWGAFSSGEIWSYVGIATLILAAVALGVRPGPARLFLAGLVVVALLYALGPETPLHGWIFRFVPLFGLVRAPARTLVFVDLGLALLAGLGVTEISRHDSNRAVRLDPVLSSALRVLLVVLAALLFLVLPLFYSLILGVNAPSNRPVIAVDGLNLLAFYLALGAVLLWTVRRRHLGGAPAALAAIALIVFDLFGATAGFNPTSADVVAGYRQQEAVAFLQSRLATEGPYRIESVAPSWQPDLAAVAGIDDVGGLFDPMQLADYDAALQAAVANRTLPLYDLLGARYLVGDARTQPPATFTPMLHSANGLVVWQNSAAMPRAWLTYQATGVNVATALDVIRRKDFNPRAAVLLTGSLAAPQAGGRGAVTFTSASNDIVTLQVSTDRPAVLVLADVNYPGWVATVDGRPTAVATADGLFRAVAVPAGNHQVVFRFQPPLVRDGEIVSAMSGLLILGMLVLGLMQRRWRKVEPAED